MKAFHNFFQGYQASGSWIQITTSTGKSCNNKHVTAEWLFLCVSAVDILFLNRRVVMVKQHSKPEQWRKVASLMTKT